MNKNSIFVTKPDLPAIEDLLPSLNQIWKNKILTNQGPFHKRLESELCKYLEVENVSLFTNATIALITSLKALNITGEVITSPFSFVATSHSLMWNGIKPVFVDIDSESFNIDPSKIESAITPKTTAIMPVHCYGRSCDTEAIDKIAKKYNLKVVYDAAHAFGVKCHCGSLLNHGDLSVLSFHATKVFNTFEGGAIVSKSKNLKEKIDRLKNFGFENETSVIDLGINGKMSEFNSAVGLIQLKQIESLIEKRKKIYDIYINNFENTTGIKCINYDLDTRSNYSYFPILVQDSYPISREQLYENFKSNNIFVRRYFYPLISSFDMYKEFKSSSEKNLPIANLVANQVLCLPIYPSLKLDEQMRIINIVKTI